MARSKLRRPPEEVAARLADSDDSRDEQRNGHEPQGPHTILGPLHGAGGVHRPRWRGYTAFVLSGGGARGALQVGALRALLEAGERPDVVVGTSIGAWNGAVLASDPTLHGIEKMEQAWQSAHPTRVLLGTEPRVGSPAQALAAMRALAAIRRLASGQPSLYGDVGMRQLLDKLIGSIAFEELAVPLRVIAADITHGKRVIFGGGPVAPAVLASSAIPGIFPPVRIGDAVYVDGGALDNASIETALALGARRVFVLDVGYDGHDAGSALWSEVEPQDSTRRKTLGALAVSAVLERTTQVISRYQLDRALKQLPRGVETHVLHVSADAGGGALEFEKAPQWIAQGYEVARAYLERERARRMIASVASPASLS